MNAVSLIPVLTSITEGFFIGLTLGYFAKKIFKIIIFVAGGIVGLSLYLQQQQIISINIDKLEESTTFIFTPLVSAFDKMTQIGDAASLGIPLIGGLSVGLAVGFTKG